MFIDLAVVAVEVAVVDRPLDWQPVLIVADSADLVAKASVSLVDYPSSLRAMPEIILALAEALQLTEPPAVA